MKPVSYRIDRWQQLTGADMRVIDDATRSVIARRRAGSGRDGHPATAVQRP